MSFIKEKIKITCETLLSLAHRKLYDIENMEYVPCDGYKTDNTPPEKG